ncbi:MAG: TonB-dependent receptor [Thermoanaerobaculia bacterium]|nr:TonB-dependent receptor [Thermoanaerobaculia bacterium]
MKSSRTTRSQGTKPFVRTVLLATALLVATLATPAAAQSSRPDASPSGTDDGALAGRVETAGGEPARDARVRVLELDRRVAVGDDGSFTITGLPPGSFYVEADSRRHGRALEAVEIAAGRTTQVVLVVDVRIHSEEIVVSTSANPRHVEELYQPVGVLSGDDLAQRVEMSLGDTLGREPGVSSSFFGQGAGRPIIRGLGGDRVRVLQNGIDSGDASTTSPDHAVAIEPMAAERIEIARGPATLLYGSSAIGGVVNVFDGSIPEVAPNATLTGDLTLRGATAAEETSGGLTLEGRAGERFAWHLDGFRRETEDYEIPNDADVETEVPGILENSAVESEGGTLGLSWVFDRGFFGVAVTGYDSLYGIPGGHAHEEEGEEEHEGEEGEHGEESVRIDLEQRRLDLAGAWRELGGFIDTVRLRLGRTDYEHVELEGDEVGTVFRNELLEVRTEAVHRRIGPWHGSFGLQASRRDFAAIGEEAFTPPSETDKWALFAFEELDRRDWRFQFGGRYESQRVDAAPGPRRDDDGLSLSVGAIWAPSESHSVALNVARSTKLPNAEELFSDGPHLATGAFELGNPDLDVETSLGVDLTLRADFGRWDGSLTLFRNEFSDFIFQTFTGEVEDGLPVARYTQADADFTGAEAEIHIELLETEPHHLELDLVADVVRAELARGGDLPRIPAARLGASLHYRSERWSASADVRRIFEQDRVATFEGETPTPGYTLVGASVGYRFFTETTVHRIEIVGKNLTDEVGRVHTSFLKDEIVLPGRDFALIYRLSF